MTLSDLEMAVSMNPRYLPSLRSDHLWFVAIVVIIFLSVATRPAVAIEPAVTMDTLVFSTPELTADTLSSEIILKEAYRRIGIAASIVKLPPERALLQANTGAVDGEVQRIGTISRIYPNLVRVDPSINFLDGMAFTKNVEAEIRGWNSLRPYRVGILRGIKFLEANTANMNVLSLNNYNSLFAMLRNNRLDIVVTPRFSALHHMKAKGISDVHELPPALVRLDLFHYLNRKHVDLIPRISAVLRKMVEAGELVKIRQYVRAKQLKRAEEHLPFCNADDGCIGMPPG